MANQTNSATQRNRRLFKMKQQVQRLRHIAKGVALVTPYADERQQALRQAEAYTLALCSLEEIRKDLQAKAPRTWQDLVSEKLDIVKSTCSKNGSA